MESMETSVTPNMAQAMQGTEDVPNDPGYVFFKFFSKLNFSLEIDFLKLVRISAHHIK